MDDLLGRSIIRISSSEYASPIVLTRKKNGEIRMCVDYRTLNKVLARDNYPLPLIEDQLDTLRGKKFYTILDLKDRFYHIAMSPKLIKFTSFVTPLDQFEYVRMLFGLKIGPQLFQRFINEIFAEFIKERIIAVYMNDILIASNTLDSHLATIKKVFQTLVKNKLELHLEKCFFLCAKIEYLGYSVTESGIRPTDKDIKAVQNFPEPKLQKKYNHLLV